MNLDGVLALGDRMKFYFKYINILMLTNQMPWAEKKVLMYGNILSGFLFWQHKKHDWFGLLHESAFLLTMHSEFKNKLSLNSV